MTKESMYSSAEERHYYESLNQLNEALDQVIGRTVHNFARMASAGQGIGNSLRKFNKKSVEVAPSNGLQTTNE